MKRTIIALLEVDDDKAFKEIDDGPISYLDLKIGLLEEDGIVLKESFIMDDDEIDDKQRLINNIISQIFDSI